MVLSPALDPLDMVRAAEVILVLGFLKPALLTGGLTGLSAFGLGTVSLAGGVARVR